MRVVCTRDVVRVCGAVRLVRGRDSGRACLLWMVHVDFNVVKGPLESAVFTRCGRLRAVARCVPWRATPCCGAVRSLVAPVVLLQL